ncbi:MAG: hypothetical protein EBZ74_10805 [Planctomycetia bacterium]|nr:hypothetical protein [Planctomycetia bacterium]
MPWLAALLALVALAWCAGTGRWTSAAWNTPSQYLDGFYGDVVSTFAWMKAAGDGHVVHVMPRRWVILWAANWVGPGRKRKSTQPGASGVIELAPFEFLDRLADLIPQPREKARMASPA